MLERRLCVYNAGLKVDASREILTVVMTSSYENVRSCKRHTVVCRAFCFSDALCSFLALRLTTVSLDTAHLSKHLPQPFIGFLLKFSSFHCFKGFSCIL